MTKTTNTTITSKSVNKSYRGFGKFRRIRKLFNQDLYSVNYVIKRVDISWNALTKQYDESVYYTIVSQNPLMEEFGLSDKQHMNFKVFCVNDEEEKTNSRRINIDGERYVLCESIIAIQCQSKRKIDELDNKGYELDGKKYVPATASPSNEKHAVKYFALICEETPDEETVYERINRVMGGSLDDKLTKDPKTGKAILVNGKDIGKANTRIGNYASGMKLMGIIDPTKERVAYVNGSMNQAADFDEATKELMDSLGVEIDANINDGAGYLSATKMMNMINDNFDLRITEEEALRIAPQTRWTVFTAKIMARVLKSDQLEALAKFYNAEFYGNPDGELVALIDKDGAKMVNFTALREKNEMIKIYFMALANASGVRSCGQHLIKYMAVDQEKTLEIIEQLTEETIDNFVSNKLESDEADMDMATANILAKLTPEEIYSDSILMESIYSEAITFAKSMIGEMKLPLDGVYTHMMFDLTYALLAGQVKSTLSITNEGFIEAYNPDVLRVYADEIKAIEEDDTLTEEEKDAKLFEILSGTVVKFPSAMPREYEIIVYQTDKQIERKINAMEITNEEKQVLVDYFNNTPYGCTVYAPINAMKNKLAGADCDFDACMCDMSELKYILINKRLEEQETNPGFIGDCTFISYKELVAKKLETKEEEVIVTAADDLDC